MFTMVYAMTYNGWLTLIICRDKNLKSCNLENQAFSGPIPSNSVLPAAAKEFTR